MSLKWADEMPQGGRIKNSQMAAKTGKIRTTSGTGTSCQKTLQITLFFDGTNNNDDVENDVWCDSRVHTYTNVARLFNAARVDEDNGIFRFYIPGVGTPFKQIGENTYTTLGKSFAMGFGARCVWGCTRVLNAVYSSIASNSGNELILGPEALALCHAVSDGKKVRLARYVDRLGAAHRQAVDEGARPRTIEKVWINVIGFSRGAAPKRAP